MGHQLTAGQEAELEGLMKEFPDWALSNPGITAALHQPRFHKNRKHAEKGTALAMTRRATTIPKSENHAMYVPHVPRPRSSKRPPPEVAPTQRPAMSFSTNQREEYVPKDLSVRAPLIVLKETYEHPSGAFNGETSYNKAYVPLDITASQTQHLHPSITDGQIRAQSQHQPTFRAQTTNKESYKRWNAKPALRFTELPTLLGSLLYPDPGHSLESTTKTVYTGQQAARVGLVRQPHGHIQLEGAHDMSTTTQSVYRGHDNPQPASKAKCRPQLPVQRRGAFLAKSQSQADYGSCYSSGVPVPPQPVAPHPETIELRYNDKTHFCTEQQSQYPGVDVESHPPPRLIMPESESYATDAAPTAESRYSSDFKPHDIAQAYVPPTRRVTESERRKNLPTFHAETSSGHFYKHWAVEPRKRYVDFHEGHKYIPPQEKFNAVSTTRTTYAGEPGQVAAPYVPVASGSLTGDGSIDFGTMYRSHFTNSQVKKLNQEQMANLLTDLRRRKRHGDLFTEKQVVFAQGVGST